MNPQFILAIAIGGALGSVARYLVGIGSGKLFGPNFPFGTLIINVTGSALIGVFIGLFAAKWDLPKSFAFFLLSASAVATRHSPLSHLTLGI